MRSIALVDDDRNILTSVSMALEAEEFEVDTYIDGTDALRGLSRKPVDLVVLDIKMPRMEGTFRIHIAPPDPRLVPEGICPERQFPTRSSSNSTLAC